ncbi:NAD-dependent epimerase/dehydratase family protein [Cyanobium sp. FGCU-52]|nr:NAD-dependent epimerase/dehydratase family protein [Cyanobium sp. FGCU52]
MTSVLVFGVSGFLGRYIAHEFLANGYPVIGVDAGQKSFIPDLDLFRYEKVNVPGNAFSSLLAELQPWLVINCAGSASVGASFTSPSIDFQANTMLVFEVLEAIRLMAPDSRFIMLSSAAVYGNPSGLPISENHRLEPLSPYGFHKLQAESLCLEYSKIHGIKTAVARIFSAYGSGLRRQVIWDIVRRSLTYGELELMGTGEETRDFLHAKDVALAIRIMAEHSSFAGEAYNVASGEEVSIQELATLLTTMIGTHSSPRFNGQQDPGSPKNWRADIGRLQGLGFTPSISLMQGLQDFLQWSRGQLV